MALIERDMEYAAEGRSFPGFLAYDDSRAGAKPGVLVCHEGTGLGDYTHRRAIMLAELGYVAFAPDLYGERFESREQGMRFIQQLAADAQKLRARARAALQALKALTQVDAARTAAIGYCFGGMVVLEMARDSCDLRCVVSFHGSLQSAQPMAPSNGACKILVCTGADDPFATPAQRATFEEEMKGAGANWQMSIYGNTRHGFTNRQADSMKAPGVAYSELADTRSWRAMRDLFEETLAPP